MSKIFTKLSIVSGICLTMAACEKNNEFDRVDRRAEQIAEKMSSDEGAKVETCQSNNTNASPMAAPKGGFAGRTLDGQAIEKSPFSTVSIDVDTASYVRGRAALRSGKKPNPDLVRPEDYLNYFPYSYSAPKDDRMVQLHQELMPSPWTPGAQVLAIGLKAKDLGLVDPPRNLVFLVDVSGSMAQEDKLPLMKASLVKLTDSLRPEDRIALVTYAGYTQVALDSTPGSEKDKIKQAINRLGAGGSTNGGSGITLAYEIAQKQFKGQAVNRVTLATDGDFNVGVTNSSDLVQLIRSKCEAGIFLTILGFGLDGNDPLMEDLARNANGNYFFIDTTQEAEKVFGSDLKSNIVTVAKDVKIQIEFNPRLVKSYRLIGYCDRILQDAEFNQDARDAGDMGSGQTVTYLYEITPRAANETFSSNYQGEAGVDPSVYQNNGALSDAAARDEIGIFKLRYKTPEAALSQKQDEVLRIQMVTTPSIDTQWQLAVAEAAVIFGEMKGIEVSLIAARAQPKSAIGDDPLGLRAEFIKLLDKLFGA